MTAPRRIVWLLGALGTLLCQAGSLGVWYVELRIDLARQRVFERVDQSLSTIGGRVTEAQQLATKSKITVEDIQQRIQDWTQKEASDRLTSRFEIEAKVQRLVAGLRQAESMLEIVAGGCPARPRDTRTWEPSQAFDQNANSVEPLLERNREPSRKI